MRAQFACLVVAAIGATGCPDINSDGPGELADGPTIEFDPGNSIIPFPNNLVRNPITGKVNLPAQCNESPTATAVREGVLNKLDGFGAFESALQVTLTDPVDEASLAGRVVLYKRVDGITAVDPAASNTVPVLVQPGTSVRFDASCANPHRQSDKSGVISGA